MTVLLICTTLLLMTWLILVECRYYATKDDYNEKQIRRLLATLERARARYPEDVDLWL